MGNATQLAKDTNQDYHLIEDNLVHQQDGVTKIIASGKHLEDNKQYIRTG